MFALAALIAFVLSPFIPELGPWPMVTVGLALLTVHVLWPWSPWPPRRSQ